MKYMVNHNIDFEEEIIVYLSSRHNPDLLNALKAYKEAEDEIKEYYRVGIEVKQLLDTVPFIDTELSRLLFKRASLNDPNGAVILNYAEGKKENLLKAITINFSIEENINDKSELLTWLYKSDLNHDEKYLITSLLLDFDNLYQNYRNIVEAYRPLENELNELYKPFEENYLDDVSLQDQKIPLTKELGIEYKNAKSINIYPFIGNPTRFKIEVKHSKEDKDLLDYKVYVGVSVLEVIRMTETSEDIERKVQRISKFLSDKTKFDILKMCKERAYYGGELANLLDLSGATVSHHVNELAGDQLLTLEVDKNRVYYKTNTNELIKNLEKAIHLFK